MDTENKLLDVPRAAEFLGITEKALRHLVELKKVPFRRPSNYKRIFFDKEHLYEWTGTGEAIDPDKVNGSKN